MIRDLFESATANGPELMTAPQQNRQPGREADQSGQCGSHQLSIRLVNIRCLELGELGVRYEAGISNPPTHPLNHPRTHPCTNVVLVI